MSSGTASVGRSLGRRHPAQGITQLRSSGMSVLLLGRYPVSMGIPARRPRLGTPSRPRLTVVGSAWLANTVEKKTPSNGVTGDGESLGFLVSLGVQPAFCLPSAAKHG
jgi:hypothetical protein